MKPVSPFFPPSLIRQTQRLPSRRRIRRISFAFVMPLGFPLEPNWKSLGLGLCKQIHCNTCQQKDSGNHCKLSFGSTCAPASRAKNGSNGGYEKNRDCKESSWVVDVHWGQLGWMLVFCIRRGRMDSFFWTPLFVQIYCGRPDSSVGLEPSALKVRFSITCFPSSAI